MPSYHTTIKFSGKSSVGMIFTETMPYRSSQGNADTLEIFDNRISIESPRDALSNDPLHSANSTLHKQILKSLTVFYLLKQVPVPIQKVTVCNIYKAKTIISVNLSKTHLRQVLSPAANLVGLAININEAKLGLEETPKGKSIFFALTHLLRSRDSSSPFDRFEKLWKAFNALYKLVGHSDKDFDCLVTLRTHMEANPQLYPLGLASVSGLTYDEMRLHMRWNELIFNNFSTSSNAINFRHSISRNSDLRILKLYFNSLSIRKKLLQQKREYLNVLNHLQNGIATPVDNPVDVLATICLRYIYFVRNKIVHAERTDHGFSYLKASKDEKAIAWLNPIIEAVVLDLVNCNSYY